jgi:leader peptidase (prepilin peptidase)/N-methyltransferase
VTDAPVLVGASTAVLAVLAALLGVTGLAVGSFVNVVVHRVPAGLSVVRPRSRCPVCGHHVRARDNVPVLSWLLLAGRCRDCSTPIPVRYPATELGTAALFVLVATGADGPPELFACLAVAGAGVALALIDLEHGRLPFGVTASAAALATAALGCGWVLTGVAEGPGAAGADAWPAAAGAGLWLAAYGGIWLLTAGRGLGLGDVALAPVLGLVLGAVSWSAAAVGLAAGFLIGAAVGALVLVASGGRRGIRVPFGPFMLVGAVVGLLAGTPLAAAYLRAVGLA